LLKIRILRATFYRRQYGSNFNQFDVVGLQSHHIHTYICMYLAISRRGCSPLTRDH